MKREKNDCKFLQSSSTTRQKGVKDCGVFAIAFAYHAAKGNDLRKMIFGQKGMHAILYSDFRNKHLEPFSHTAVKASHRQRFFRNRIT